MEFRKPASRGKYVYGGRSWNNNREPVQRSSNNGIVGHLGQPAVPQRDRCQFGGHQKKNLTMPLEAPEGAIPFEGIELYNTDEQKYKGQFMRTKTLCAFVSEPVLTRVCRLNEMILSGSRTRPKDCVLAWQESVPFR